MSMNAKIDNWIDIIHQRFKEFYNSYRIHPGMVLTEGDMECMLHNALLHEPTFHRLEKTIDGGTTIALHSQVTWFRALDKYSGFEVDLTICDPSKLEIDWVQTVKEYPNKGFYYKENSPAIAIELKFIRDYEINKWKQKAVEDYKKIIEYFIPSYLNILEHKFKLPRNLDDLACFVIIGCKNETIYESVKNELKEYIKNNVEYIDNIFPIVFSPKNISIKKDLIK
jgi:hypothetical protein